MSECVKVFVARILGANCEMLHVNYVMVVLDGAEIEAIRDKRLNIVGLSTKLRNIFKDQRSRALCYVILCTFEIKGAILIKEMTGVVKD